MDSTLRAMGKRGNLGMWEVAFSREKDTHIGCPVPPVSPDHMHPGSIIQTDQVRFRNRFIYNYICVKIT